MITNISEPSLGIKVQDLDEMLKNVVKTEEKLMDNIVKFSVSSKVESARVEGLGEVIDTLA